MGDGVTRVDRQTLGIIDAQQVGARRQCQECLAKTVGMSVETGPSVDAFGDAAGKDPVLYHGM